MIWLVLLENSWSKPFAQHVLTLYEIGRMELAYDNQSDLYLSSKALFASLQGKGGEGFGKKGRSKWKK